MAKIQKLLHLEMAVWFFPLLLSLCFFQSCFLPMSAWLWCEKTNDALGKDMYVACSVFGDVRTTNTERSDYHQSKFRGCGTDRFPIHISPCLYGSLGSGSFRSSQSQTLLPRTCTSDYVYGGPVPERIIVGVEKEWKTEGWRDSL